MYRVYFLIVWINLVTSGSGDEVSDFRRRKLATFLSVLNPNSDGVLEENDFHRAADRYINSCNWKLNETVIDEIHNTHMKKGWKAFPFDRKGEGKSVTPDEFFAVMPNRVKDPKYQDGMENLLKAGFSMLDVDGDGLLNLVEYSSALHQFRGLESSTIKPYYDIIDINHDNVVTMDELMAAFVEYLVGEDEDSPNKWMLGPLV